MQQAHYGASSVPYMPVRPSNFPRAFRRTISEGLALASREAFFFCYTGSMKNFLRFLLNVAPLALMLWLIRLVTNDYTLTIIYLVIIAASFGIKRTRHEMRLDVEAFAIMTLVEW